MPPKQTAPFELSPAAACEPLPGGASVGEFWAWSLSDLRMNTTRGHLAEFLVARALGDEENRRVEWAPYDVRASDGTRVEVKTAGYA